MRWRQRSVFVLGGIVVGMAPYAVVLAADHAGDLSQDLLGRAPVVALFPHSAGLRRVGWIARRYFLNSGGSGIPQAIAASALYGLAARERLVSIRIAIGKTILLLLGLLCGGAPSGHER